MQRKRSKSLKKSTKKKPQLKKNSCSVCDMGRGCVIHIQNALYRKYSWQHYSYLPLIEKEIKKEKKVVEEEEYLDKYYKNIQRKHQFHQIKQIYKLHTQTPRLFLLEVRDILIKCHHRKRLLEYFKIAKILGLKVQSVKFSTFLFSVSKSLNPQLKRKSFDRIIGHISGYQFSQQIQKQLIQSLKQNNSKENNSNFGNIQNQEANKITVENSKTLKKIEKVKKIEISNRPDNKFAKPSLKANKQMPQYSILTAKKTPSYGRPRTSRMNSKA